MLSEELASFVMSDFITFSNIIQKVAKNVLLKELVSAKLLS